MLISLLLSIGYIILLSYISIIKTDLKYQKDHNRIKRLNNLKGL